MNSPHAFLLRLPSTIREKANLAAKSEGVSLNHLISVALLERIVRTDHFMDRADLISREQNVTPARRTETARRTPSPGIAGLGTRPQSSGVFLKRD